MSDSKAVGFSEQIETCGGEIGKLICSKDWRTTPLGDIRNWPLSLTSIVTLGLTSEFPVAIWWGGEFTVIYNQAFQHLFHLHLDTFGTKGSHVAGSLWDAIHPSLEAVLNKGEATKSRRRIALENGGGPDQDFIFYYSPIFTEYGTVGGVFTTAMISPTTFGKDVGGRITGSVHENELRIRLALQASAMGTFDWDIAASEFQYSERLAHIFGYNEGVRITQNDFVKRIHPDDMLIRQRAHEEAFITGSLFYEVRLIWPDGSLHWVRLNGHIVFDNDGKPWRMYGTALDITGSKLRTDELERKVKERTRLLEEKNEELRISEERYYKMTEEVQDYAIILLDRDGTILNWNKGAEKIKGYRESEIIGKNFSVFYLEEDRKRQLPQALIRRAEEEGRAMHEGWRKRKDGSRFWGSIVITALHDDLNNVIGFTKVTRDLTERKMAEDIMRQHAFELETKNKQLEQFAYIASHDLQEPLRKIQTFVQVLERKLDNPEVRERYFHKINSSAKRMGDLIQAVLNYSRLSQDDELRGKADLNDILEHVKSDYELLIEEKQAVIEHDQLPVIRGVSLQLSQLFANLIGNSLKFSDPPARIKISSRILQPKDMQKVNHPLDPTKQYVELIFQDYGIGFEQQYAEKIFTIFQRLNSREAYGGTGIGLALCKRIVENHDGYIHAVSALGSGASFFVYLPLE